MDATQQIFFEKIIQIKNFTPVQYSWWTVEEQRVELKLVKF